MSSLLQDFRYALRVLAKAPAVSAVIVLALALGIGANTSNLSSLRALVLRPFPFKDLDRIVVGSETLPRVHDEREPVSPANFLDWKEQANSFERMAAFRARDVNLTGTSRPERLQGFAVSADFFALLGIPPALGRTFSASEEQPGRDQVIVISNGFWKRQLAADPGAAGRAISLNGRRFTVVGVMPEEFDFPLGTDVWTPLAMGPAERGERNARTLGLLARLKTDVSVEQASAETAAIASRLERLYPDANRGRTLAVLRLREVTNRVTDHFVFVILAASMFVLLLACANVANLQLAHSASRARETAMRAALGASRWRIARQFLAESAVLSFAGGALGLLVAFWESDLIHRAIPAEVYRWVAGMRNISVDASAFAIAAALSVVTAVACGIIPAVQSAMRADLNGTLAEGSRGNTAGPNRHTLRGVLVASEVALALILLVGAALMVQTFNRLITVNPGYNPKNALRFSVALHQDSYGAPDRIRGFQQQVLAGLRGTPGVKAAAAVSSLPRDGFLVEGRPEPTAGEPTPEVHGISSEYFRAMGIPVLSGRPVGEQDGADAPRVAVVSQSIAQHYWNGKSAVGSRIRAGGGDSPWATVVGVAGDRKDWFSGAPLPAVYLSAAQVPVGGLGFVLRTAGDPVRVFPAVRAQVLAADRDQPVYGLKTLEQALFEQTSGVRMAAYMMTGFAIVAILLAASGIYAVISYAVAQRRHEIGVRLALGAQPGDVMRLVVGHSLKLAGLGLAIGLPSAAALMWIMAGVLYGVVTPDLLTLAGITVLLGLAAALAGYLPARRACGLDPLIVLRHE